MAKRKQKNFPAPTATYPAVSVIIPLYNAERYIAECLDSILAQTFQNFEVIVVDDCSTDSSCAIVESYVEKFGGRLTLAHMKENSGNGGLPRNKGLTISRGEYVFFMDADDLFTKTALEELYMLAKDYGADYIYIESHYEADDDLKNMHMRQRHTGDCVDKPTFESEDLTERLKYLLSYRYGVTPWIKFIERNLLLENELFFPHLKNGEDDIWTYSSIFYAKKLLRVPNAVYIQRLSLNSNVRAKKTPSQLINFWMNPLLLGLKSLDKMISRHDFFKKNPPYRYAVLNRFVNAVFYNILTRTPSIPPFDYYETIKNDFGTQLGEQDVLVAALCTLVTTLQRTSMANVQQFQKFAAKAQARIAQLEAELKRRPL